MAQGAERVTEVARTAIRAVRFKRGGEVRVLRPHVDKDHGASLKAIRAVIDQQGTDFAGYGFVAWGADGGSSCTWWQRNGYPIPTPLIPEFVKTRLVLGIGVRWTLEDVNEALGFTPPPGDAS